MKNNSKLFKTFGVIMITVSILSAQGNIWDGTANTSWYYYSGKELTINTAEELAGIAKLVNNGETFLGYTFKLGADIVLNDTIDWQNWGGDFSPANAWTAIGIDNSMLIGIESHPFSGTFDGNGYIISGIYINNSNMHQGLFGYIDSKATIKNLGIIASYIKGASEVGGLVGRSFGAVIDYCYVKGNVKGSGSVGGLVGNSERNEARGVIRNSYATGNVEGSGGVGGLVGDNGSIKTFKGFQIINCYSTGNVEGSGSVGGLIGRNTDYGEINDCYATGNVKGNGSVGGLVGSNGSESKIESSYATGNVIGYGNSIGGLVGINSGQGEINNCYATGIVDGSNSSDNVGGLVGENIMSDINNCYAIGKVIGAENVGGLLGKNASNNSININGDAVIKNCYATGNVIGTKDVGGLVGETSGDGNAIINCYAVGEVTGNENIGGLVSIYQYDNGNSIITNSYYNSQTSGQSGNNGKGEPRTTEEMKQMNTFVNWDFEKIWVIDAAKNNGYPYLGSLGSITSIINKTEIPRETKFASFAGITNGQINLRLQSGFYNVELFNLQGRLINKVEINAINGINAAGIKTDKLSKGIFILNVKQKDISVLRQKIVIGR